MSFVIQQGLFKHNITDHYAILGCPLDADGETIRQQYLKVARKLHPDTCKFKTQEERNLASKIFSQLVAPSSRQLSNDSLRLEYLSILVQTGLLISRDAKMLTITSEIAQKLYKVTSANLNKEYDKIIKTLSEHQYDNIQEAIPKIAEISEVNIVYVIQKQGQEITGKPKTQVPVEAETPKSQPQETPDKETSPASPAAVYIKRAEEYLEKNEPNQAMTELRDVIKLNPNDSSAHALMGIAYLKQNQITMAKVHIDKAIKSNFKDPNVIKARLALSKSIEAQKTSKNSDDKGPGAIFKNLFGGKKNPQ